MATTPLSLEAYLAKDPCSSGRCLSYHEQLVLLVYLWNSITANAPVSSFDNIIRKHRNLSNAELIQSMIGAFTEETIDAITPEDLKCLTCFTDRTLLEILTYLQTRAITALS